MTDRKLPFPKRAHVELTSICNFKCITCKHGYIHYGQDMDDNVCDILIHEIIPHLEEIELQGTGESLLSHNFNRVFDEIIKTSDCKLLLITNASLLNKEYIHKFVRANMQIVFSLDGANDEIFHKHRPVGDFNEIRKNIELLRDMKKEFPLSRLSTVINMVLTKHNMHSIKKMIDFAIGMNIDYLFVSEVRPCMPDTAQWDDLRLDRNEMRDDLWCNIIMAEEYAKQNNLGFRFNSYHKTPIVQKEICPSPWQHVFISADGNVSFCCELNSSLGNLKEMSFETIWNGDRMNLFRNQMLLGEYHAQCLRCCLPWGITHG